MIQWLKKFPNVEKKAVLLYGPPGVGKTTLVEVLAREFGYDLVEMNASDFRRSKDIERIAILASDKTSLLGKGKIILLDEVDGIHARSDAGGIEAILRLINITKQPIIMTANDPWSQSLKELRENAIMVGLKKLGTRDIMKLLKRICEQENIEADEEALRFIVDRSEGDLRSAINDLEAIAEGYGKVDITTVKTLLRQRDKEQDPFETLRRLFTAKYAWQAKQALSNSQLDYEMAIEWLNENLPIQLEDPEDLWRAYESLSRASIYLGRIIKSGEWDLLSYAMDLMGPGVAFSRKNKKWKWVKYRFPERIKLLSKTKETRELRETLARIIAEHTKTSRKIAKSETLPFLRVIFESNIEEAAKLSLGLRLPDNMIRFLAGNNASSIIKLVNKYEKELSKLKGAEEIPVEKEQEIRKEKSRRKTRETERSKETRKMGLDRFFKT